MNDTVVTLFFSMKTSVRISTLMWKTSLKNETVDLSCKQPKLVMMSWRYVVINKCIVSLPPYMENGYYLYEPPIIGVRVGVICF